MPKCLRYETLPLFQFDFSAIPLDKTFIHFSSQLILQYPVTSNAKTMLLYGILCIFEAGLIGQDDIGFNYNEIQMQKLSAKGIKWLKGFHLVAVSCWIGSAVSLLALYFLKNGITDGNVLYGINRSIHHVDMNIVVIPGAIGSLLTGLIYSIFTHWGFFKHNWLTFKWIVTATAILFGTFYLGPWETAMMEISGKIGIASLTDPAYLYSQQMNVMFGTVQVMVLIITIFVSILKPWKSKKQQS
jgi:uncharacterized membrane protein